MRIIDADELRKVMYHEAFETDSDMQKWDEGCWIRYKMFEKAIDFVPPIEAEPVQHGRWILGGEEGWPKWTCSVCGGDGRGDYKLCPWCGAKMDGGNDDADGA